MTSENPLPSTVSRLPSAVSLLLSPVSCLPSPVSRLMTTVSCVGLMSPVSGLLSPVSVSCLPFLVSHLLSPVSCLPSPVSRLMSPVLWLPFLVSCLPWGGSGDVAEMRTLSTCQVWLRTIHNSKCEKVLTTKWTIKTIVEIFIRIWTNKLSSSSGNFSLLIFTLCFWIGNFSSKFLLCDCIQLKSRYLRKYKNFHWKHQFLICITF